MFATECSVFLFVKNRIRSFDNHPDDIMSAILPEEEQDEFPTGFSIVGHVGAFLCPSVVFPFFTKKK